MAGYVDCSDTQHALQLEPWDGCCDPAQASWIDSSDGICSLDSYYFCDPADAHSFYVLKSR